MSYAVLLCVVACVVSVQGYSHGAPEKACSNVQPGSPHRYNTYTNTPVYPKISGDEAPFSFHAEGDYFYAGMPVTLTIQGLNGWTFKGFMLRAYDQIGYYNQSLGSFMDSDYVQTVSCGGMYGSAATHKNADWKSEVNIYWQPPYDQGSREVHFVLSVVATKYEFWVDIRKTMWLSDGPIAGGAGRSTAAVTGMVLTTMAMVGRYLL